MIVNKKIGTHVLLDIFSNNKAIHTYAHGYHLMEKYLLLKKKPSCLSHLRFNNLFVIL
jgi:hypothetical protein